MKDGASYIRCCFCWYKRKSLSRNAMQSYARKQSCVTFLSLSVVNLCTCVFRLLTELYTLYSAETKENLSGAQMCCIVCSRSNTRRSRSRRWSVIQVAQQAATCRVTSTTNRNLEVSAPCHWSTSARYAKHAQLTRTNSLSNAPSIR